MFVKESNMYSKLNLFISLLLPAGTFLSGCNRNTGPSGVTECFLGTPYYSEYQWGICLTQEYIKTFSKGKYRCRDTSATYCYYQCMLEMYNLASGPVYSDCSCKQGEAPNTNVTVLPSSCFSPSGSDCDWYENCLEKRYPCRNTEASYAIDYAKKFCDLYTQRYNKFSDEGRRWVDDVRKCLQVQLVPILRPYRTETCQNITDKAFESHVPCYINPTGDKSSSFCSLPILDKWRVFWTVKSAFVNRKAQIPSILGLFDTLSQCLASQEEKNENVSFLTKNIRKFIIKVDIKLVRKRKRRRRSAPRSKHDNWVVEYAYEIVDGISKKRQWPEKGIIWFALATNATNNNNTRTQISVVIAEQRAYDLNYEGNMTVNLTLELDQVTEEIQQGKMVISVGGHTVHVVKFKGCYDVACNATYNEIESIEIQKPKEEGNDCKFPECWERKTIIATAAAASGFLILLTLICICVSRRKSTK